MTAPEVIVFDVDGVLVDVTASYREAIRETVRNLTGELVSNELIQKFKNEGGWNNDWELSYKLILDRGRNVEYGQVVDEFNRIFFGNDADGLIQREYWMPGNGFFTRVQEQSMLAIFTGRVRYELTPTLERFAPDVAFDPVITSDDVKNPKPAPDGLHIIKERHRGKSMWYLGDTVDDARAAKGAAVPFIGVASKESPRYRELVEVLTGEGAFTVLSDVNELLNLLPTPAGRT
ncbi:MAG: HAD hydrolase-like protein [Bryobacteraceae bacterium]